MSSTIYTPLKIDSRVVGDRKLKMINRWKFRYGPELLHYKSCFLAETSVERLLTDLAAKTKRYRYARCVRSDPNAMCSTIYTPLKNDSRVVGDRKLKKRNCLKF